MAHKTALHGVEDYDVKAMDNFTDPPRPFTWEEAVVNLLTIDTLGANNVHMKIDYTKGLVSYAYPDI